MNSYSLTSVRRVRTRQLTTILLSWDAPLPGLMMYNSYLNFGFTMAMWVSFESRTQKIRLGTPKNQGLHLPNVIESRAWMITPGGGLY